MIEYDLEVVETLVDDYTGNNLSTHEGTTMGWTIIRNSDGQTRHVNDLTKGALNVLAEAFDGIGELGGREAAYRSAVGTLQKMLDAEVQQAEEDDASALLLAQQADVILSDLPPLEDLELYPPTDVVERIGEYTGSKEQPSVFEVGQRVLILTDDEFMQMYDGATGVVKKIAPETSVFAYLVTINGNLHGRDPDAYLYANEVVALPAI